MIPIKSEYYRFNGTSWDLHYFKTSADVVLETTNNKIMTADERTAISNYLSIFNVANKLLQLDANGKVAKGLLPDLTDTYLSKSGGSLTGNLNGTNGFFSGNINAVGIYANLIGPNTGNKMGLVSTVDEFDFSNALLKNVPTPISGTDGANKDYVDGLVAIGTKPVPAVKVATTGNQNLSGLVTIDGFVLSAGDRVLVWKQTTPSENGIYTVGSGAWTKVSADSGHGSYVFVENGNTYNDWYFYCKDNAGTWIDSGRPDTVKPGDGLEKSGTTLKIKSQGVTNDMLYGSIGWGKLLQTAIVDTTISAWGEMNTGNSLHNHLENVINSIKLLRGETGAYTNSARTIKGAYDAANAKINSEIGSSLPATTGQTKGNLFFKTL